MDGKFRVLSTVAFHEVVWHGEIADPSILRRRSIGACYIVCSSFQFLSIIPYTTPLYTL